MTRRSIFLGAVLGAAALLLLPSTATAEIINVYPGPDEEWNYLYDFGDVEVGSSGVMLFQIENDPSAEFDLVVYGLDLEDGSSFTLTDAPTTPQTLVPGASIYVEVTFTPVGEGFFEGVFRITSNGIIPPGTVIDYNLRGMGVVFEPPPDELMQAVLDFFAAGITDGSIVGAGSGGAPASHVRVFGNMLDAADDLIAAGDFAGACQQLDHAVAKSDGLPQPPDFLVGTGVSALNAMILDVMDALGC